MPAPSSVNAISIVSSRPMWSETQPKNGRVSPFSTRSIVNAKVSAGSVRPRMLTGMSPILKSFAIGASCATAISPPAATRTNITYMTQNTGSRTISSGWYCRVVCGIRGLGFFAACFAMPGLTTRRGSTSASATSITTIPWPKPK